MGSFDKAFKSKARTHRERVNGKTKGFLERKKDYKVRAAEYQRRQNTLNTLKKKALDKNPNEFHFHMKQSRLVDGIHYDERKDDKDEQMNETELKIFKSQDKKYINYKRSIDNKKIDKLQAELHMINDPDKPKNKHIFFVQNNKEKKSFNIAEKLKVDPELLQMGFNFANPKALKNITPAQIEKLNRQKALAYRRLDNKIKRTEFLTNLSKKMDMKRDPKWKEQRKK